MAERLPNIVLILADDLGYGDVSCLNPQSRIATPHLDALASQGMTFRDAHSSSAVCTPSRYSLLTGRYCWRGSLQSGVLWGYDPCLIEPGRLTLAEMLRQRGYATACVGKWHLGLGWRLRGQPQFGPEADPEVDWAQPLTAGPHTVGFDYSYVIPASLDMAPYVYIEDGVVVEPPVSRIQGQPRPGFYRGGWAAPGFSHETCLLELTQRAEAFISYQARRAPEHPFFLYFALPSPHTPHLPRAPFRGRSRAGEYGDLVVETDWTVGRILGALQRLGMTEDTLVVFASDNGCHASASRLWERFQHRGNGIYRGEKSDVWDGGHRVPLFARWPGRIAAGSFCDELVCLSDWMATCAAIVGYELPLDAGEDSFDLLPYLLGQVTPPLRESVIHHSIYGMFAVREREWKLVLCKGSGGWTLEEKDVPAGAPPMQLYNLREDPSETRNLWAEQPEVVERLLHTLAECRRAGRSAPVR